MKLRNYQKRSIEELYDWLRNHRGNPCLNLPTASGKSIIIAELCRDAIQNWSNTKIILLTHVKELIEQDLKQIKAVWENAPVGVYSAGVGRKELGYPITVAGIQSIYKKAAKVGFIDVIIVDEAHLISHKSEGMYRNFISDLKVINPNLRVIGLTATPYRLGHGLITDKPAIFDEILEPTSIEELLAHGYLSPLRSKCTDMKLSTSGVHKRGGEFIESELQKAVNTSAQNIRVVNEIISYAADRKAWLLFCTGVKHAHAMCDLLNASGVPTACVTGETPKVEREKIIELYTSGSIKAVTNANVLTTGFNYPDIDLIAFCRPTLSPGLYIQMAGRGMRIKSHTDHCLVLDFAGNVRTHGPITAVTPPGKKGSGNGEAPVKVCENCQEFVHLSVMICPACGADFPPPKPKTLKLHSDDIMGHDNRMDVSRWYWRLYTANSGKEMVIVSYYSARDLTEVVTEYLCLLHGGYAQDKAQRVLKTISKNTGAVIKNPYDLREVVDVMNVTPHPNKITRIKNGKYYNVTRRTWDGSTASN